MDKRYKIAIALGLIMYICGTAVSYSTGWMAHRHDVGHAAPVDENGCHNDAAGYHCHR